MLSQSLSLSVTLPSALSTTAGPEHPNASSGTTPISTSALVYSGSVNGENHEAADVQPTETQSRLFNLVGSPPNDLQSSTNPLSFSSTTSPRLSSPTISHAQSIFSVPQVAATPLPSSVETQAPSSSGTAFATSSTAAPGQTPSQVVVPIPISSGVVQVLGAGGDTADEFGPVTLNPSTPAPTGTAKYPTAEDGNIAMATGFNKVYAKLSEDTPCNPGDPSQAYACVEGEIAECQSDETYVLKSCPRGQSCYALPKPSGLTGVVVQCAVPSDAASMLAGLSSSTAVPMTVTSPPAQILQAEEDFSQSAQSSVQPVKFSPSAQSTVQSQKTSTSSVLAVMTTAQEAHDSNPLNNSPKSDAAPPTPPTTAAVFSIPKAMFAVVTAVQDGRVSHNENSAQTSLPTSQISQPSPAVATPVIQSSVMSPQASPYIVEASVPSTSTTSADGATDTFASMKLPVDEKVAIGDGQATVTVTVTVTTTENSPAVTVTAS